MQVELAQLEYMLPRLSGQWAPSVETERRNRHKRARRNPDRDGSPFGAKPYCISEAKASGGIVTARYPDTGRRSIPGVALVGYTNAGKSTLMNALCPEAEAFAENRLFATLDTKTRRLELKINKLVLLSDTVGFIRKLPHDLVESFKSTLDEVLQADFLLHVIDASHPGFAEQMQVVRQTLKEIGSGMTILLMFSTR